MRHITFALFLIIIITSPRLLSGDVLLFYISFSLLLLSSQTKIGNLLFLQFLIASRCIAILRFFFTILIITSPRLLSGDVLLFYYYYITPTAVWWCIVILRFFFTIITSPRLLSGDVLLFYVSFSLLLWLPNVVCETYYSCTVSYCYIFPTVVGWCSVILRFFSTIIIIIIIIIPHVYIRSISRRCLDQTLWNLVGISYAMWSCAVKGWFFQNGCRCHGNGQNAKKLKNAKNDHSRLLAKQKLMKLDRKNIHN